MNCVAGLQHYPAFAVIGTPRLWGTPYSSRLLHGPMELNYPMAEGLNAYLLKFLHNYKKKNRGHMQWLFSWTTPAKSVWQLRTLDTVGHSSVGGGCVLKKMEVG